MTTEPRPRSIWFEVLGGFIGLALTFSWGRAVNWVLGGLDDALPDLPIAVAFLALVALVMVLWSPWIPLLVRAQFPWWYIAALAFPLVGLALGGVVGVRVAARLGEPWRPRTPAETLNSAVGTLKSTVGTLKSAEGVS